MSHPERRFSLADAKFRLVVVQDQPQSCPYLPDTVARMPLRLPIGTLTPLIFDELLANGYRRSGDFLYRTQCPDCCECRPTRVDVSRFCLTKSMRRVLNRGDRELRSRWGLPQTDATRVRLFNEHRSTRGLGDGDLIDLGSYQSFLGDSCCQTLELSLWLSDQLIGVAIMDVGQASTSSVYTHFDPQHGRYSLGTYAVLKQIEWAAQHHRQFVYLGMYVAANEHLNYKARFRPQQRLLDGKWVECDGG